MENARSNGPPWQSRLIPYEEEILELRRRRPPMPFDQITTRLPLGLSGLFRVAPAQIVEKDFTGGVEYNQ